MAKSAISRARACALVLLALAWPGLWGGTGCRTMRRAPLPPAMDRGGFPSPRVRPGLVLSIRVLVAGDEEIDLDNKRVRNDGTVMLPLLGVVNVDGLTLGELSSMLQSMYNKSCFVDPSVEVEFADEGGNGVSPWGSVTVLGRVKKPGRVSIPPTRDLTVSRAIQEAGGFDTSAKSQAIRVSRRTAGGETDQMHVNLNRVGVEGEQEEDIVLQPGDIVFVPESVF